MFRNHLAQDMSIPPFTVASNKLLGDLCISRPSDIVRLTTIDGVSEQWIKRFSKKFLDKIGEFCGRHSILKLNSSLEDTDNGTHSKDTMVKVIIIKCTCTCI